MVTGITASTFRRFDTNSFHSFITSSISFNPALRKSWPLAVGLLALWRVNIGILSDLYLVWRLWLYLYWNSSWIACHADERARLGNGGCFTELHFCSPFLDNHIAYYNSILAEEFICMSIICNLIVRIRKKHPPCGRNPPSRGCLLISGFNLFLP